MSKFNPGDLALVVSGSTSSVNVGRTVLLLESMGSPVFYEWDGERYHNVNGDHIWIIEAQGEALVTRFGDCAKRGPIGQRKLMPLRGDFQPEQQKAKEMEV